MKSRKQGLNNTKEFWIVASNAQNSLSTRSSLKLSVSNANQCTIFLHENDLFLTSNCNNNSYINNNNNIIILETMPINIIAITNIIIIDTNY